MVTQAVLVVFLVSLPVYAPIPGELEPEKSIVQPPDSKILGLDQHELRNLVKREAAQHLDGKQSFSDSVEKAVEYLNTFNSSQMEIVVHTRLKVGGAGWVGGAGLTLQFDRIKMCCFFLPIILLKRIAPYKLESTLTLWLGNNSY